MTNKPLLALWLIGAAVWALAGSAKAQTGRLQLDQLNYLNSRAKETVEVTLDRPAVQLLAKLAALDGKEQPTLRALAPRIQGLYVRSYEFDRAGEYSASDVDTLRTQLRAPGWQRLVQVRERNGENNEVYFTANGDLLEGVTVVSAEPRRLCVANLVGQFNLEELNLLDREFGVLNCGKERHGQRRNRVR